MKTVTMGLPIYKRLEYLPQVLPIIEAQDYPAIDLLVSDNGTNGSRVREIVEQHYSRPFRFRQNPVTVDINQHFNQLVAEATGEYFVLLCDDDEISPNYVSELVALLERHPDIDVAFSRQESIDEQRTLKGRSVDDLPERVPGDKFMLLRANYKVSGIRNTVTHLSRTVRLRECGGWPTFPRSIFSDEALVMKLALGRDVAFSRACVFRNRVYPASFGTTSSCRDLAAASRQFLRFVNDGPEVVAFAAAHPLRASELRKTLSRSIWSQYYRVWRSRYRSRLPYVEWVRAGFGMPPIAGYYARLAWPLAHYSLRALARSALPASYRARRRTGARGGKDSNSAGLPPGQSE
ncbi:MAG TPA: glycosyltransferase [Longimicrobiaceae bacterium]